MKCEATSIEVDGRTIKKGDSYYTFGDFISLKGRYDTFSDTHFTVDKIEVETDEYGESITLTEVRYPYDRHYSPYNLFKNSKNKTSAKYLYFDREDGIILEDTFDTLYEKLRQVDNKGEEFDYDSEILKAKAKDEDRIKNSESLKNEILKGIASKEVRLDYCAFGNVRGQSTKGISVKLEDNEKYGAKEKSYFAHIKCGKKGCEISEDEEKELIATQIAIKIFSE